MKEISELEFEQLRKVARGTDKTQQKSTNTSAGVETSVNLITVGAGKVLYVCGVNYIDRAHISAIKLYKDDSTTPEKIYVAPLGPSTDMGKPINIDPPIRCVTSIDLKVLDDGTAITGFKSVITAFEADQ